MRGYSIVQMSHTLCSPECWQRAETILLIPSLRSKCALRRSRHPCSSLWPPNGSSSELPTS
jgi:hypothetical protein